MARGARAGERRGVGTPRLAATFCSFRTTFRTTFRAKGGIRALSPPAATRGAKAEWSPPCGRGSDRGSESARLRRPSPPPSGARWRKRRRRCVRLSPSRAIFGGRAQARPCFGSLLEGQAAHRVPRDVSVSRARVSGPEAILRQASPRAPQIGLAATLCPRCGG